MINLTITMIKKFLIMYDSSEIMSKGCFEPLQKRKKSQLR